MAGKRSKAILWLLSGGMLLSGCCVNPFGNTHHQANSEHGRPGSPEAEADRSIQPALPAIQPTTGLNDNPGAGFDIRLTRVQPGVHIDTQQSCDVVYSGRPEAVDADNAFRYGLTVVHRLAIKCRAPTGEGWADLIFSPEHSAEVATVTRGRRLRVRIVAAQGGYFDYPIVEFLADEGPAHAPSLGPEPAVPSGFNFSQLEEQPSTIGTTQNCAVGFADEIELISPGDRRRRSYPAGVQNRMTVRCRHGNDEVPADLVFMPAQALAGLAVRRGEVIPVQVISRTGGFVDYPILQFAGP